MTVCIRLSRFGRTHRPLFRVVAIDKRCHREGMANEIVGLYDPLKSEKNLEVDATKIESWVNRGAQISEGVRSLMKKYGYAVPTPAKTAAAKPAAAKAAKPAAKPAAAKAAKPADGKAAFVPATRRSVRKHAAKLKAERMAKTAADAAAKAAAAEAAKPAEAPAAE